MAKRGGKGAENGLPKTLFSTVSPRHRLHPVCLLWMLASLIIAQPGHVVAADTATCWRPGWRGRHSLSFERTNVVHVDLELLKNQRPV